MHTAEGCPICPKFNSGHCQEVKNKSGKGKGKGKKEQGSNCPDSKAHVCSRCLGRHSAKTCHIKDY
jgi:hypothetical protein